MRVGGEALSEHQVPRSDTESRLLRWQLDAVDERHSRPRVVREQEVAVEVDVVEERRDLRARGDAQSRLDHAAEHAAEPERAGGVHHAHRLADPARFRELDVDPVRALGARGHVGEGVAVLVDVDRDRRAPLQLRPARVAGRQRLLAVLDPELGERRKSLERLVEGPGLVHVDLERQLAGDAAHRADALDVEPVPAAELELEAAEATERLLRAPRHVVGIAEPDRPARRRPGAPQAEQPPHRLAEQLALQVVQRGVERGSRGELAGAAAP